MSLEQLMDNPYAWLILALCTIFSFAYAIYMGITGKEKKEISYMVNTYEIVHIGKNRIPECKISYGEQVISDLTVSRFAIWNSGNKLLSSNDIVKDKPLSIKSDKDGPNILDVSIIKHSEECNMFTIDKKDAHCAEISFDYMGKQDGIIVQVFHTGKASDFQISCKIKGGEPIKHIVENSLSKMEKKFLRELTGIYIAGTSLAITIGALLSSRTKIFPDNLFKPNPIVQILVIIITVTIISIMWYQTLKKKLHWSTPYSLRGEIDYKDD